MQAVALLGGHSPDVAQLAWGYGRHLGLAFQITDDILDLTATSSRLGKPALNDLKSGIATAPVLLAAQQRPELLPLIRRRFREPDDVAAAVAALDASDGLARARELAAHHAEAAADTVRAMPPPRSEHAEIAREGLLRVTERVLNRSK